MFKKSELTGEDFLLSLCEKITPDYKSLDCLESEAQFKLWQDARRHGITVDMGLELLTKSKELPETVSITQYDEYTKYKYILPTSEKLAMPLYVLVPKSCNGRVMLALHGHGCYGKEGITGNLPKDVPVKDSNKEAFALDFVRQGYITVCPDLLGSGERTEDVIIDKTKSLCDSLNNALIAIGLSLQSVIIFELMRVVDFALTISENKYQSVFCCGFSGGGLATLLLSALDKRISAVAVSGYFHTMSDTCLQSNKCGCNFSPGVWRNADCGVLAALISPRPLYIELGDEDNLHGRSGLDSVNRQFNFAQRVYTLLNVSDNLQLTICNGGHKWYGTCYNFFNQIN
jgi:dienelactone hydrolase